jgi:hypothetical protein
MHKCDRQVHKLPFPSEREVMCETPLETSAVCKGQEKWSPEPMGKLHLFKYSLSFIFPSIGWKEGKPFKITVKQYRYRPGVAQRVPGS